MNARDSRHTTTQMGDISPHTGLPAGYTTQTSTSAHAPVSNDWVMIRDLFGSPILFPNEISLPQSVSPGGVVDVVIGMENRAQAILDFWTDDVCNAGGSLTFGYEYEVTIDPSWLPGETFTHCLGIGDFGSTTTTHTRDFQAPDSEGTYSVGIQIQTAESGVGNSETFNIDVDEDSDTRPDPDPVNGGGGGISDGFVLGVGAVFAILLLLVLLR